MPTGVHELFIDAVEDEIRSQLKAIRNGSDRKAQFAQKVRPARSTEIRFGASASSSKSKYEPDASFRHEEAKYPGVIIEIAYSQKKTRLRRLAENYLLDSDANVQAVVCLDIEYGKKASRKATLSIWRPQLFHTADGSELRAVEVVADKVSEVLVTLTPSQCSDVLIRLSVTTKEMPSITLVYCSASAISPTKNLPRRRWEMKI
jgi:hypothetical protein